MMKLIKQDAKRLHVCSIVTHYMQEYLDFIWFSQIKNTHWGKSKWCGDLQNRPWIID